MKRNKYISISLINFQCADTHPHPQMLTHKAQWGIMSQFASRQISHKSKYRVGGEKTDNNKDTM